MLYSAIAIAVPGSSSVEMRGTASHDDPASKVPWGISETFAVAFTGARGTALAEGEGSVSVEENIFLHPCIATSAGTTDSRAPKLPIFCMTRDAIRSILK